MSKKSRKKREGQAPSESSAEAIPQEKIDPGLEQPGQPEQVETLDGETVEVAEVFTDSVETDEEASSLPEAVTEEALSGDVGEVPPLSHILEAILFASQKAVTPKELVAHLKAAAASEPNSVAIAFSKIREPAVEEALQELQAEVAASGRAYQVRETATGWLLSSAPGFAPWLRALYPEAKPTRLSPSALETLAIIAYRQPIARADMEAVRGVSVDGVMQTLLDRGLVKIAGRAEVPGRPLLYATTQYFLDHFGLRNLDELPNAAELRHIPLPKATPEPSQAAVADDSTPELPGVSGEFTEESAEPLKEVDVTEIIEVRESVVFEEVAFDAEVQDGVEPPEKDPGA
jgi:segregation and condensation protein B